MPRPYLEYAIMHSTPSYRFCVRHRTANISRSYRREVFEMGKTVYGDERDFVLRFALAVTLIIFPRGKLQFFLLLRFRILQA